MKPTTTQRPRCRAGPRRGAAGRTTGDAAIDPAARVERPTYGREPAIAGNVMVLPGSMESACGLDMAARRYGGISDRRRTRLEASFPALGGVWGTGEPVTDVSIHPSISLTSRDARPKTR